MEDWSNERMGDEGRETSSMSDGTGWALEAQTAALVRVAAAVARGNPPELKARLAAARDARVPGLWIEELLLQSTLVVGDAYGKVIGRPGLDLKRRELCTVATTAVLGTAEQLHSHLRGALNTGAEAEEIEAVLGLIEEDLEAEQRRVAAEQWLDVKRRML